MILMGYALSALSSCELSTILYHTVKHHITDMIISRISLSVNAQSIH